MKSRALALALAAAAAFGGVLFACVGDSNNPLDGGSDASTGNDAAPDVASDVTTNDAGDGAVAFNPKSVTGLKLWLEADKGLDVSDAGAVSAWHDQSGNAADAVPDAGTSQYLPGCTAPLVAKAAINGVDAINFTPPSNGIYPCLQLPSGFGDFTTGATVFAIARIDTSQTQTKFLAFGLLQSPNFDPVSPLDQVGFERGSTNLFMSNWNDVDAGDFSTLSSAASSAGDTHEIHAFEFVLNAGSAGATAAGSMFMDGNQLAAGTDTKPMAMPQVTPRNMNTIGWAGRTSDQVYGLIGELLLYNNPLKTSDRLLVEQYLRTKWGTP